MPTTAKLFIGGTQIKGGLGPAVFDEASSTGATFTTLTNPDGDGKNYRLASFTSTSGGSLIISEAGVGDVLLVGGGGGSSPSVRGGGGGGGAVLYFPTISIPSGSNSVTVGAGGGPGTGHYGGAPGGVVGSTASQGGASSVSFLAVKAIGGGGGGAGVSAGTSTSQNIRGTFGSSGGGAGAYSSNSQQAVDGMGFSNNGSTAGGGAGALGSTASGATKAAGIFNSITGVSVEYGAGGTGPNGDWGPHSYSVGIGWGGRGNAGESGGNGAVYIRVEM